MLVLTRKSGEKVMIGDDIELEILESSQGRVKLGFSAPIQIDINRLEIHNKNQKTKLEKLEESTRAKV